MATDPFYEEGFQPTEREKEQAIQCLRANLSGHDYELVLGGDEFLLAEFPSSGQKKLLSLFSFVIKNRDKEILFFDCPEDNIFIGIQKWLVNWFLAVCGGWDYVPQIIMATHSPSLIKKGFIESTIEMNKVIQKTSI